MCTCRLLWLWLKQLAVAEQEDLRRVAADRHVDRQIDASPEQAPADKADRVVGFLEQPVLLLQADQARAEPVIGGLAVDALAEIEIGEADAELLQGFVRSDGPERP